ncbi:MAG: hypothetical protein ACI3T9_01150 [Romboutsia timonensis]
MNTNITETMKKLLELSKRGMNGEKENAEKLLKKLMRKYNIKIEDLEKEDLKNREIRYRTKWEEVLIHQIIYMINPKRSCYKYTHSKKKVVLIECTDSEFIEFNYLFEVYKKAFEKELEVFTRAFVIKNEIFPRQDQMEGLNNQPSPELDYYEILKTKAMMEGMEYTEVRKAIGDTK